MSVVDLHPDDLFDREAEGLLSPEERARLDQHLAHCGVCRLERQLRADFETELAPYAETASLQRFVSGALLAASETRAEPAPPALSAAVAARPRGGARRWAMLMAATLLFVSGVAAAQAGLAMRAIELVREAVQLASLSQPTQTKPVLRRSKPPRAALVQPAPVASVAPAAVATASPAAPAPAVVAPAVLAPAVVAPSVGATGPALPVAVRRRAALPALPGPVERAAGVAATSAEPATTQVATAPTPAALSASNAASLFEAANVARREGRWLEASALYRELRARHGDSAEARLSLVVVGRMRLDHGEVRAALADFEAYLSTSHTALREEAMVGRAIAYRRLGREAHERDSVDQLLRAYPDSPYGVLAGQRLGQGLP